MLSLTLTLPWGESKMTEDDIENDNMDDDEESDDLQEFSIKQLGQAGSTNQTGLDREIFIEDMIEVARQAQRSQQKEPREKAKPRKTEFNPWRELDKVSKKNLSRRQILRGVFKFLPEKKNE
jgi:hypothetical protein